MLTGLSLQFGAAERPPSLAAGIFMPGGPAELDTPPAWPGIVSMCRHTHTHRTSYIYAFLSFCDGIFLLLLLHLLFSDKVNSFVKEK